MTVVVLLSDLMLVLVIHHSNEVNADNCAVGQVTYRCCIIPCTPLSQAKGLAP